MNTPPPGRELAFTEWSELSPAGKFAGPVVVPRLADFSWPASVIIRPEGSARGSDSAERETEGTCAMSTGASS
jgi:hypothetical protein